QAAKHARLANVLDDLAQHEPRIVLQQHRRLLAGMGGSGTNHHLADPKHQYQAHSQRQQHFHQAEAPNTVPHCAPLDSSLMRLVRVNVSRAPGLFAPRLSSQLMLTVTSPALTDTEPL